ncbi:hypothetical protein WIX39_026210 [Variovorax sp. AB1(2024)]|uniref:hypothetical protein n=1 Tax=Variovorax sp. AB1(2024) TaxID=3132214 RepID=UPI0030A91AFA
MTLANLTTIAALPSGGGAAASLRKDSAPAQKLETAQPAPYRGFEIIDIVPSRIPSPFSPESLTHWRAVAEGVSAAIVNLTGLESAARDYRNGQSVKEFFEREYMCQPTGLVAPNAASEQEQQAPRKESIQSLLSKFAGPGSPWVLSVNHDAWRNTETGQEVTGLQILQHGFPDPMMGGEE